MRYLAWRTTQDCYYDDVNNRFRQFQRKYEKTFSISVAPPLSGSDGVIVSSNRTVRIDHVALQEKHK